MADHLRIGELRRRVDNDPASIAFAQLAEEYRRSGEFEEAIRVCRAGLDQHPAYLSARVTLGRALLELERYGEAQTEFEQVLRSAPDNLIALRSMADIHQRRVNRDERGEPAEVPPAAPVVAEHVVVEKVVAEKVVAELPVAEPPAADPVLEAFDSWLSAILDDRASRASS